MTSQVCARSLTRWPPRPKAERPGGAFHLMGVSNAQRFTWSNWMVDRVARGLIATARALPYERRVPLMGWLMRRGVGGLTGARARVKEQLYHIWPDLPEAEVARITEEVLDNFGRTLIENYSTEELLTRAEAWEPQGPGLDALAEAREAGRPALLITGHFGNYEAPRAALTVRGYSIGGLYRPMNNGYFNRHYIATMESFGGPVFPRGTKGVGGFVRHLKKGGQGVILTDQYAAEGEVLDFLGKPAPTATAAAEIALKYDAPLIPFYGTRRADGLNFDVELEAPIPRSDPIQMTQALNDSLAARITANPGQWFWVHRRWKPGRQARFFADTNTAANTP